MMINTKFNIMEMWIARDDDGTLYLFKNKPVKGISVWRDETNNDYNDYFEIDRNSFPEIQWEDSEPTSVTITIN